MFTVPDLVPCTLPAEFSILREKLAVTDLYVLKFELKLSNIFFADGSLFPMEEDWEKTVKPVSIKNPNSNLFIINI
jgi:hypothetical protein